MILALYRKWNATNVPAGVAKWSLLKVLDGGHITQMIAIECVTNGLWLEFPNTRAPNNSEGGQLIDVSLTHKDRTKT